LGVDKNADCHCPLRGAHLDSDVLKWIPNTRSSAVTAPNTAPGFTQVWRSDLALWTPAARYVELQQALARLQSSMPPATARRMRAAGFWLRLGAYMLDRVILVMVFGMICQWKHWTIPIFPEVLTQDTFLQFMDQMTPFTHQALPWLLGLPVLYDVLFNGTFGATPGKMAVGAKIVGADGSPAGYRRALLRSLAGRLAEIMFYVGYLWILARSDKRGPHDLLAGTRVVMQR
jgi:uncharacterized RDD family membrane protein YckC